MIIKSITLGNYRLYEGKNIIKFTQDDEKPIFLISGENGFGKTTFLHSLIEFIDAVDEFGISEIAPICLHFNRVLQSFCFILEILEDNGDLREQQLFCCSQSSVPINNNGIMSSPKRNGKPRIEAVVLHAFFNVFQILFSNRKQVFERRCRMNELGI